MNDKFTWLTLILSNKPSRPTTTRRSRRLGGWTTTQRSRRRGGWSRGCRLPDEVLAFLVHGIPFFLVELLVKPVQPFGWYLHFRLQILFTHIHEIPDADLKPRADSHSQRVVVEVVVPQLLRWHRPWSLTLLPGSNFSFEELWKEINQLHLASLININIYVYKINCYNRNY